MEGTKLAVRINPANPDHHLWNNHSVWWCHLTLHTGLTKWRQRLSLHTTDIAEARNRRDRVLAAYRENEGAVELECRMMDNGALAIESQMEDSNPLLRDGWRVFSGAALVQPRPASLGSAARH